MSTRDRLREAAFDLFAERGFEGTTVDDIAERAGVGRTTFFRSFASKEDVIFPDHDRLLDAISARLASSSADTAPVAVSEAARLVLRHYLDEGDVARSRYRLTSTVPALRAREVVGQRSYQHLFGTFIHEWLGGTPDTALRAELMASAVITAHNHALRGWLRGRSEDPEGDFDRAMEQVTALFEPATDPAAGAAPDGAASLVVLHTTRSLDELLPALRTLAGSPEHQL